jgi:hypothetical protein
MGLQVLLYKALSPIESVFVYHVQTPRLISVLMSAPAPPPLSPEDLALAAQDM